MVGGTRLPSYPVRAGTNTARPTAGADGQTELVLTQPGMERQGSIPEIVREVLARLLQRLLHDVRRIDARDQATIQPHRHHPDQPLLMPDQELLAGPLVAAPGSFH